MATNFPASLDTLTNPTSSDSLSSPSHSAQHANVNDAVEAIETALLDGAPLHIDDANERVGVGNVSPSYKLDVTGDINSTTDIKLAGDSMPRGIVAYSRNTSTANGGINAGAEATALTVGPFTPIAGRKYKVTFNVGYIEKITGDGNIEVRLRTGTSSAGTLLEVYYTSGYSNSLFYDRSAEKTTVLTSAELGTSSTYLNIGVYTNTNQARYGSSAAYTTNIIVEDIGT